jgi:SAM-dependent methyltransferase
MLSTRKPDSTKMGMIFYTRPPLLPSLYLRPSVLPASFHLCPIPPSNPSVLHPSIFHPLHLSLPPSSHVQMLTLSRYQLGGGRALDFGCGLGRMSFALSEYFEEVTCVDQSKTHLATAAEEAKDRNVTGVKFVNTGR